MQAIIIKPFVLLSNYDITRLMPDIMLKSPRAEKNRCVKCLMPPDIMLKSRKPNDCFVHLLKDKSLIKSLLYCVLEFFQLLISPIMESRSFSEKYLKKCLSKKLISARLSTACLNSINLKNAFQTSTRRPFHWSLV